MSGARIELDVALRHPDVPTVDPRWHAAVAAILAEAGMASASISLAVIDDAAIHSMNRQFLDHDEPTDVITFELERDTNHLEGEIVVSFDTARAVAERLGVAPADELLLYVIHGALHLAGYDDLADEPRRAMREAENRHLAPFGLTRRDEVE